MTPSITPGPSATRTDLLTAQERRRLLRDELANVRATAAGWRNGLAGLLAALTGFSLIRGRSDISQLAHPWDVAVGLLLLLALLAGVGAALCLLRATSGSPVMTSVTTLPPIMPYEYLEAWRALRALRLGIALSLCCGALLVTAIATTWYGPQKVPDASPLQVQGPTISL
jgi:hypothetical protein